MTQATQPYLATPQTVTEWAQDGDATAARFLRDNPDAAAFGVDDDEIQIAFVDVYTAGEWLKDTLGAAACPRCGEARDTERPDGCRDLDCPRLEG